MIQPRNGFNNAVRKQLVLFIVLRTMLVIVDEKKQFSNCMNHILQPNDSLFFAKNCFSLGLFDSTAFDSASKKILVSGRIQEYEEGLF